MANIERSFPVLSVKEVLELEKQTEIDGTPLSKIMKNVGQLVANFIKNHKSKNQKKRKIYFICGSGNNGGDGLMASIELLKMGIKSTVVINGKPKTKLAADAMTELLLQKKIKILNFEEANFEDNALLIDAVFGTGLSDKPLDKKTKLIIEKTRNKEVISIDIASGVNPDTAKIDDAAIMASHTLALGCMKKCHVLFPGSLYCGNISVLDIGLSKIKASSIKTNAVENFKKEIKPPSYLSHKYSRGHLMVVGGDRYTTGASILSALAGQKTLSGIVTICSEKCAADIYAAKLSSIMLKIVDKKQDLIEKIKTLKINSVVIGPGSGINKKTFDFTIALIENKIPCVIDADSITVFQEKKEELFNCLNKNKEIVSVITPHDGEFQRIFEKRSCKIESASLAAKQSNSIIVYKGADTIIADPMGNTVINNKTPHNLSTAGSGDVLSGIIGSLMSAGMTPWKSALAGVWIHSECARSIGRILIAEEIIAQIPKIIQSLFLINENG